MMGDGAESAGARISIFNPQRRCGQFVTIPSTACSGLDKGNALGDLVMPGGEVVTPMGVGRWDVGVKDGRVASVALEDRSSEAARVFNAEMPTAGSLVVRARRPALSTPPVRSWIAPARRPGASTSPGRLRI